MRRVAGDVGIYAFKAFLLIYFTVVVCACITAGLMVSAWVFIHLWPVLF